jgi:hypothetical protein
MGDITQNFSQLLRTYGPGAMLDLPENAVVVAGLQDWDYKGSNWRPIEEERLVALLRQQLGAKLSPAFSGLRHPPMFDEERRDSNAPGVAVRLFPSWPQLFVLVYSALIPAALMIGHHFSISDGTQLGVGEFAGLRVVGMV